MTRAIIAAALALLPLAGPAGQTPSGRPQPARSPRLYVFDCGILDAGDPARYELKKEEVDTDRFSVACFLVAHPKGTLMWDVGAVPDTAWKATGSAIRQRLVLPDSQERFVTVVKPLRAQLAETGYRPPDVTHLAVSHYHWDHTANANDFATATWLVRQVEREAMFAPKAPPVALPATYAALEKSKTTIIKSDEHDVFGDGTVLIKSAPGHTPGHQVLYVKLAQTGGVVLSGDLYHYPQERTLNRYPTFEFNREGTAASRAAVDAFLKKTGAQFWIQHDFIANARLKKAPAYYE